MSTLLTRLTLVVAAAVVGVVAFYLIQIAAALIQANKNLAALAGGLEAIRENARPLEEDLATINGAAVAVRDGLHGVDDNLVKIIHAVKGS